MKHLLDVNVLLAGIWENHSRHAEVFAWLDGKNIVLCPLAELGDEGTAQEILNQMLDSFPVAGKKPFRSYLNRARKVRQFF